VTVCKSAVTREIQNFASLIGNIFLSRKDKPEKEGDTPTFDLYASKKNISLAYEVDYISLYINTYISLYI